MESIDRDTNQPKFRKLKWIFRNIRTWIVKTLSYKKIKAWDKQYIGKFDEDWHIMEWTVVYGSGFKTTGKYKNENGYIVMREWRKTFSDWSYEDWKFDKYGRFIEWEKHYPNWIVCKWKFDVNTWFLIEWEKTYTDGTVMVIDKNKKY